MVILWILVILTILAVSIGRRVSLDLRLSRYQADRLKAYCLTRAGIQRAIAELDIDTSQNKYDTLSESWSTGIDPAAKPIFENIEIQEGSGETFTVKTSDEDGKIDINTVSPKFPELLVALLKELKIEEEDAQQLTNYIRIWRGDAGLQTDSYSENFKKSPFIVPEELIVILESFYQSKGEENPQQKARETFDALKYLVTVYPLGQDAKININTASETVLTILARSIAETEEEKNSVNTFVEKILALRNQQPDKGFQSLDGITVEGVGSEYDNILTRLKLNLSVQSNYFKVDSTGNAIKIARKITAVYNRADKKIVYWHQD